MATIYTSDDVLQIRRYQAVWTATGYIDFICNKEKYGGVSNCARKKMVVLTQWVDILLRYDNPTNSDEEALNCLSEAQIDYIVEQISKMTGCQFYSKDTYWSNPLTTTTTYEPWEWISPSGDDIQWNDSDEIDTNEIV